MRQINVLPADDDELIRSILRSCLTAANFCVLEAVDGQNALDLAVEHAGCIDVLVTDIRMPPINGLELRKRLHEIQPEMPVIVISSYASEILSVYPDLIVFQKPFNPTMLVSKIRELLDGKVQRFAGTCG